MITKKCPKCGKLLYEKLLNKFFCKCGYLELDTKKCPKCGKLLHEKFDKPYKFFCKCGYLELRYKGRASKSIYSSGFNGIGGSSSIDPLEPSICPGCGRKMHKMMGIGWVCTYCNPPPNWSGR